MPSKTGQSWLAVPLVAGRAKAVAEMALVDCPAGNAARMIAAPSNNTVVLFCMRSGRNYCQVFRSIIKTITIYVMDVKPWGSIDNNSVFVFPPVTCFYHDVFDAIADDNSKTANRQGSANRVKNSLARFFHVIRQRPSGAVRTARRVVEGISVFPFSAKNWCPAEWTGL
jgi:hypothetical protein